MKYLLLFITLLIFSCSDSTTNDSINSGAQVEYEYTDCIKNDDCDGTFNHCVEVIYQDENREDIRMRECLKDCNQLKLENEGVDAYIYRTSDSGLCTKTKY